MMIPRLFSHLFFCKECGKKRSKEKGQILAGLLTVLSGSQLLNIFLNYSQFLTMLHDSKES